MLPRLSFACCSMVLLGMIVTTASSADGDEPTPPEPVTKARLEEILPGFAEYVEQSRQEWDVPSVAVAVVFDDQIVWWKGFGERGGGVSGRPDLKTVYAIGSTTKAFCGATLAQGVDAGHFAWDTRVVDLFPRFRMSDSWVTREMRVDDLLAQHSGMPTQALSTMASMGYSRDEIIAAMGWVEPVSSFRSEFAYVNSPHLVAGKMVAQASGVPSWEAAAFQSLLEPLKMGRTTWTAAGLDGDANRAPGHVKVEGKVRAVKAGPFPYVLGPAGGLNSCLEDMSHWVRLQLNNGTFEGKRIVSQENLEVTRSPQTVIDSNRFYCMGWISHVRKNHRFIWHNGGTPGHKTFVGIEPDQKLGLIVLSNLGDTEMPDAVGFKFFSLVHQAEELDYSTFFKQLQESAQHEESSEAKPDRLPPPPANRLIGSYSTPAMGAMTVEDDDDGLSIRFVKPNLTARLLPRDGAVFAFRYSDGWLDEIGWNEGGTIYFRQNEQGIYDTFDIRVGDPGQGATFHAKRAAESE